LLPLLFALVSIAEFLHVEQSVTGLDCMSCAESAPRSLKKIKGVESASFRTKDSVAVLELKPGNTVTLGEIRDAVKRMGYTPAGAKVTVRGEARKEAGKWILRVAGLDAEYPLVVSAGQEIRENGFTIVEGSLADPSGPLKVTAAKPGE
jgi:copper chaperone CopZ